MTRGRTVVHPRSVIRTLEVCLFLALSCSCAAAFASDRTIAQFAHTAWGPKDGAPAGVTALAQTADGYLWLGSLDGLYRFDGVAFERYQPQSGGPFSAKNVSSLLALPNGNLWIGYGAGGISLLSNGHVTNYTTRDGVPEGGVWGLAQDQEETTWAATGGGLVRLEHNRWKEVGKEWDFPGEFARAPFLDRQGALWISTGETLVYLPPGASKFQPTDIKVGQVSKIAQAANGKLWMAETSRSVRPLPLSDKLLPPDETEVQVGSTGILFDNDGALWITSLGDGLRRSSAPELLKGKIKEFSTAVESFTARDGLSDDYVRAILQDREGNIWVGTSNGLDRFRKTNLLPVALPFKPGNAVLAAGDAGNLWVENVRSKFLLHEGRANRGSDSIPSGAISAYRDPAGTIWWLCDDAIYRYDAGTYTKLAFPPSFPELYTERGIVATKDGSGVLWLAAVRKGLFYWKKEGWKRLETASEFAKLSPRTAFTDWMGGAWFGYDGGTIIILDQGNIQRVFPANDSPVGGIRAINGRGQHTWVGGELGLAFFDGNRFRRIVPADAEAFGFVIGVEETSDGSLWLAESRGVIQVPASEVQHALDDPSYRVNYRLFDSFEGLQGTITGVGPNVKEIQGTDGKLWFAASGGIVWIDPARISTNTLPPPVLIRSVKTNGRQSESLGNLVLPPRTTDLQISYTALSLSVPEKVRFRYRLEGVDKDWQDAGTRREAFYTRLGPGQYHFQVIAANNDGVWNDTGARLDFQIGPTWYQTNWFRIACVGVFLALMWGLYQLRFRQLRRQFNVRLEARVTERTRIAQDLHDTFFQGIQGLLLRFHTATSQLRKDDPARQIFEETLKQSDQVMLEGRELVLDLRATVSEQNDLPAALAEFGEGMRKASSCEFKVVVNGGVRPLDPEVFEEVFKIGKEALGNAFRHSGAHSIEAELNYERSGLQLRIRDDGTGIDSAILQHGHREGHFGLPGMKERARKVGAHLDVWSRPGAGTEIELRIAARVAYVSNSNGSWLWMLRHLWPAEKEEDGAEEK